MLEANLLVSLGTIVDGLPFFVSSVRLEKKNSLIFPSFSCSACAVTRHAATMCYSLSQQCDLTNEFCSTSSQLI